MKKLIKLICGIIILLAGVIFGVYKLIILTGSLELVLKGIFTAIIITIVIGVAAWLLCDSL